MGWLYPHSPSAGCEAATLPLRSLRMSSAPASNPSSRRTRGRVTILGCGRFQCKLETLLPSSRPFPSTRRTHLKPCARVQFKRSPDPQLRGAGPGRGRASPASDSGLLGPEVGGSRRDPPGLRGGSCPALRHRAVGAETGSGPSPFRRRRLPLRAFLQRRFAPVAFFYRSAAAGTAGGGWSAGRDLRANEWAPRGRARAGLKGIRTVRIAPRARLSPSPPHPPPLSFFCSAGLSCRARAKTNSWGCESPRPGPESSPARAPTWGARPPTMRKIRANAIAILTVAWILGTFYYLWQDNRAHAASSGSRGAQKAGGRPEQLREDRTIPLIVSLLCASGGRRGIRGAHPSPAGLQRARGPAGGYVPAAPCRLCICWSIPARCYGNLCRAGRARAHGWREGDSGWGLGESAASLVGPACAREWERGGSLGTAPPGRGRGLRAPHPPWKEAGPGAQQAGGGNCAPLSA